jgi:hypothetical protein
MPDRRTMLEDVLRDAVRRGRSTSPQWIYQPLTLSLDELTRAAPNDPRLHEILDRAEQAFELWRAWLGQISAKGG